MNFMWVSECVCVTFFLWPCFLKKIKYLFLFLFEPRKKNVCVCYITSSSEPNKNFPKEGLFNTAAAVNFWAALLETGFWHPIQNLPTEHSDAVLFTSAGLLSTSLPFASIVWTPMWCVFTPLHVLIPPKSRIKPWWIIPQNMCQHAYL